MNIKGIEPIIAQPVHHQVKCIFDMESMVVGQTYNYWMESDCVKYANVYGWAMWKMPIHTFAQAMRDGAIINVKDITE